MQGEEAPVSIRNLDKIFKPQRIAVIGASNNPQSVGYTVLKNLIGAGFQGVVYPVNPKREAVQGIQAYPNVASLPKKNAENLVKRGVAVLVEAGP